MKRPSHAQRPTPRTLAAAPPAVLRAPQALVAAGASIPTLATLLAVGGLAPGCADPVCGATRADELEAHGADGLRAARNGEPSAALQEIALALGLVRHGAVARIPHPMAAGAVPVVQPQGSTVPMTLDPPGPPPSGGMRAVTPTPSTPEAPPPEIPPEAPPAGPSAYLPDAPGPAGAPHAGRDGCRHPNTRHSRCISHERPPEDSSTRELPSRTPRPTSPRPRHHPPVPGGRGAVGPLPPTHSLHRTG